MTIFAILPLYIQQMNIKANDVRKRAELENVYPPN
jgi:hypothetical protein